MRLICSALAVLALSVPALAHSWYDSDCCSSNDCAPIPATAVQITDQGYQVTLNPGDHPLATKPLTAFFAFDDEDMRPSLDGEWHACVIPKSAPTSYYTPGPASEEYIKCLYVPGGRDMTDTLVFHSRRLPRAEPGEHLPPSRLHLSEPGVDAYMPRWWRDEVRRLDRIGYKAPHTATSDHDLVRALSMGRKLADISALIGVPIGELRARWDRLVNPLRNDHGHLPVEAQINLLKVLASRLPLADRES